MRPLYRPLLGVAGPSRLQGRLPVMQARQLNRHLAGAVVREPPQAAIVASTPIPSSGLNGTYQQRCRTALRGDRNFHSSARREAVPLIPAGAAILKSASLLTIITTVSRILISFFPLGTIAAFRRARISKWLDEEGRKPTTSKEAEEFWLMWCDGEKFIQLNNDDAREVLHGELQADGTIKDARGRIAYGPGNPLFERGRRAEKYKKYLDPAVLRSDPDMRKSQWKQLGFIKASRFFMPPLPQSAERYYAELDPKVRDEVDQLRCYWASLRGFKDKLRMSRWVMMTFFILPGALLLGVYTASLERTPFTGRWRIILLTPDEEDKISTSLAGPNWYTSVINLLTTAEAPAPPVVPLNDWRWAWVRGVLHQLEKAVVRAAEENAAGQPTTWPDSLEAIPTPSKYPLRPRPRLMSHLHSSLPGGEPKSGKEHLELGPPYSLLLMQKDERNAFSYGFGGKGAGGVVVFTGLLDDILRHGQAEAVKPEPRGFFGALFGSTPVPKRAEPTEEQTLHLACVLAHEMGHLLLSHHLETLSQQQVLWPSMLGFSMDLIRAFIWPFTIFLGPAVNDALANMGRTSTEELANRYGEIGFQWKHEYEADLVGLRILAQAGFSPEKAMAYFASSIPDLHEIQPLDGTKEEDASWTDGLFKLWTRATHPSRDSRLKAVQDELATWGKRTSVGEEST